MDDNQPSFIEVRRQVFEHYRLNQWQDALSLLEQHAPRFNLPTQSASIIYWQACFLCLSNRPDEALRTLQNGLEHGLWWTEVRLRHDSDLQPLQGDPAYETLIAECLKRHEQAQIAGAKTSRLIVQPSVETPIPYSYLLALHGYAGNAATTLPDWSPMTEHGWLVVAVQSSQVADMDGFHWVDEDQTRVDVQQNIDELSTAFDLNPERMALAGFSNGARAALVLALTGAIRPRWVISVGGSLRDSTLSTLDWESIRDMVTPRFLLIVGERDEGSLARVNEQAELFQANGLDVTLQIIPETGHSVPIDLSERVIAWLGQP